MDAHTKIIGAIEDGRKPFRERMLDVAEGIFHAVYDPAMAESPHWKFIDNRRGYLVCDLDRQRWLTELRVVSTVRAREAQVSTFARFVTEDGAPGVAVA